MKKARKLNPLLAAMLSIGSRIGEAVQRVELPSEPVPQRAPANNIRDAARNRFAAFRRAVAGRVPPPREWNDADVPALVLDMTHKRDCSWSDADIIVSYGGTKAFNRKARDLLRLLVHRVCNRCDSRSEPEDFLDDDGAPCCPDCGRLMEAEGIKPSTALGRFDLELDA